MHAWYLVDTFLLLIQQESVCMHRCGCCGECSARGRQAARRLPECSAQQGTRADYKHWCLRELTHCLIFLCKLGQPSLFSISVANTIPGLPLISWSPSSPVSQSISYSSLDPVPSWSSSRPRGQFSPGKLSWLVSQFYIALFHF